LPIAFSSITDYHKNYTEVHPQKERMEELITIKEEIREDVLLIRIGGRLDAISAPAAEKRLFEFIKNGQVKLMMDLSGTDYLSSAGMRMLISVTKKLKTLSGKLVLVSVTHHVMDVLKMAGFDHFLDIAANEEEGLRKF